MKLKEIVAALGLEVRSGSGLLEKEVKGGYASDLLSDVMAHTKPGDLWITLQVHLNIVAVATLNDLAGIILVNGREPEEATLRKATEEGVVLMVSALSTFEVAGRLYEMGIRGGDGPS
ncbi:MAG: DRTGG domain-containing protein [Thermodesulfobacteriota bacterium]